MKKSNFLKNSKDMLHKSFNSAKCKTSLKLAASRLKLLKNKKEVQVKQMKRELAQLLESGQDQTARIRVEHVVREEKMMAAFDLIEIYCELIVARLPIIESQKTCPIDLKEAITSVVFASPRCGDVPELLDVRKHLTAKYGKEFISAAIELRPECGVSRLLVEKLSAKAPDGQTKIKILSAIAEEHGIKWDSSSLDKDTVPPNDLLNGPSSFEKASNMHAAPLPFANSSSQTLPSHIQTPAAFTEHLQPSVGAQDIAPKPITDYTKASSPLHPQRRAPGDMSERVEVKQSVDEGLKRFSYGRQSWNMEFKDATSAAQAAAESAEVASMAARAAAELSRQSSNESLRSDVHVVTDRGRRGRRESADRLNEASIRQFSNESPRSDVHAVTNRGRRESADRPNEASIHRRTMRQYSTESHRSDAHFPRDGGPEESGMSKNPNLTSENLRKHLSNNSGPEKPASFPDQWSGAAHDNTERSGRKEKVKDYLIMKESGSLDSLRYSASSDQEISASPRRAATFTQDNLQEEATVTQNMGRSSGSPESHYMTYQQDELDLDSMNYFGEERIEKRPSNFSSTSNYSPFRTDNVIDHGNLSTGYDDHKDHDRETMHTMAADPPAAVFDDSGSEDDIINFDTGPSYDEHEFQSYTAVERKSSSRLSWGSDAGSDKFDSSLLQKDSRSPFLKAMDSSVESVPAFSGDSRPEKFSPLVFDDSDSQSTDIEDDAIAYELGDTKISGNDHVQRGHDRDVGKSPVPLKGQSGSGSRKGIYANAVEDFDDVKEPNRKFASRQTRVQPESSDLANKANSGVSSVLEVENNIYSPNNPETLSDDEKLSDLKSENEGELNFGRLTGGLRNKGYSYTAPPYRRSNLDGVSSKAVEMTEENSTMTSGAFALSNNRAVDPAPHKNVDSRTSSTLLNIPHDSDSASSGEELEEQTFSHRRESHVQKFHKEPISKASNNYFNSDSSDSEVDSQAQKSRGRGQVPTLLSRRTKVSSSGNASSSYNPGLRSNAEDTKSSQPAAKMQTNLTSYGDETSEEQQSYRRKSEKPILGKQVPHQKPESNFSMHKESIKSSIAGQSTVPQQNIEGSDGTGKTKLSTPSEGTLTREDSLQKASHVHPKLPDYDTIAARLQAFRVNRK